MLVPNKPLRDIWDAQNLTRIGICPFCSALESREVALRVDGLKIVECGLCRVAYVDPRPTSEQLLGYYDFRYFTGQRDFFAGQNYCNERDQAIISGSITGYREIVSNLQIEGRNILDIGCATGSLLYLLKRLRPAKLIGIDTSEYPIEYGCTRYDLDLRCTSLEEACFPKEFFDIILMVDLIEHVENLSTFVQEIRRIVRPCGHIFLITPNYGAFGWAQNRWMCLFKDFEHLQYLSYLSLAEICKKSKLHLLKWWTNGLPVELQVYPSIYRFGMHRILYHQIARKNFFIRFRHMLALRHHPDVGHNLYAILSTAS